MNILSKTSIILLIILSIGCRGSISEKPPIHLVQNMDTQEKYKPYGESDFFINGSSMQLPVNNTIAIGELFEDSPYFFGTDIEGDFIKINPSADFPNIVERGAERYGLFCLPCHGKKGDGMGKMIDYKYPPATSIHSNRVMSMPDGQIFSVISNGNVLMPSYKHQIPVGDRWAIVSYIRNLQKLSE